MIMLLGNATNLEQLKILYFLSICLDLLDFCDLENRNHLVETEKQVLQTGLNIEFKEDFNMIIGDNKDANEKQNEKKSKINDRNNNQENMINDPKQDEENENILFDKNLDQDDDEEVLEEETSELNLKLDNEETENEEEICLNNASQKSNNNDGLWEDIYGRQRDKQSNVVSNRYVPPAVRVVSTDVSVDNKETCRLQKQLKGILNRLAEQNMYTIAKQVIDCQQKMLPLNIMTV